MSSAGILDFVQPAHDSISSFHVLASPGFAQVDHWNLDMSSTEQDGHVARVIVSVTHDTDPGAVARSGQRTHG